MSEPSESDPWKTLSYTREEAETLRKKHSGPLECSSFSTLFPVYREDYIKTIWSDVKEFLSSFHIVADLDLVKGSMTVQTTRKTWDPFSVIKARDLIKLLARSVPFKEAKRVMEDDVHCEIVKIGNTTRKKDIFVKRRERIIGPNGATLKALEVVTDAYIHVQGQTVSLVGSLAAIKKSRKIVLDTMKNIHPLYNIKEMMIRNELMKSDAMKNESWDKFIPKIDKKNVQVKKKKKTEKKKKKVKKETSLFPPLPTPRKEDIEMMNSVETLKESEKQNSKIKGESNNKKRRRSEVGDKN